jgi:WD40 repeat protein
MARIFLSHSSKDGPQAERLLAWLRGQGFTETFLDIDKHAGLMPGDDWERRLYREIAGSEAVILILTANWFESKWCFAEFIQARALGKAIFPIIETPTGESFVSPDIQHLDLVKDRAGGLARLASELTRLALNARGSFPWDKDRPVFPGLLAFDEADAAIYFGRDDDIRRVIERMNARRAQGGAKLIAVLGASGSGKSSLLRAGVLPRLKRDPSHWIVLPPFRPQLHPVDELAQALAAGLGPSGNWRQCRDALMATDLRRSLSDIARDLLAAHGVNEAQVVLSIDQTEELFSTADPADVERMHAILNAAVDEQLRFMVLMTLRSDYLGQLQQVPGLTFEEFSLKPMVLDRVRDVIEGPARVAGIAVEDALVGAAMKDAATQDALPLLAFTLRELRDRFGGDRLTLANYQSLGDPAAGLTPLENALRKRADEVLDKAKPAEDELEALRQAFVPAMVRVNEEGDYVRRPARWTDLPAGAHALLRKLADARLLVIGQDGGETSVEVAHEALLRKWPRLRAWLDQQREFLIGKTQLERALADWERAADAEKDAALLHGLALSRATQWLRDHPVALTEGERRFIRASQEFAEAELRRRKRLRQMLAVGAAACLVVLALAGWQWREAERAGATAAQERTRAEGALLAFRSQAYLGSNALTQAVTYGLQAFELSSSAETRSALLQSLVALSPHLHKNLELGNFRPAVLAWSGDGSRLVIGGLNGGVRAWEPDAAKPATDQRQLFGPEQGTGSAAPPVRHLIWTDDVTAVLDDGQVLALKADSAAPPLKQATLIPDIARLALSADGLHAVVSSQSEAAVYAFACRRKPAPARELDCGKSRIADDYTTAVAIARDGSLAAVALEAGGLVLIDLTHNAALAKIEVGAKVQALAWHRRPARGAGPGEGAQDWLAVGTAAGEMFVVDAHGERIAELPAQQNIVTALAWDEASSRLASSCDPISICVWTPPEEGEASFRLAATLAGHLNTVLDLAWSPNGERIASTSTDQSVKVWSIAPDRLSYALPAPGGVPLTDFAASPDGKWLAAGSANGEIQVWSRQTLDIAGTIAAARDNEIKSIAWSPDGGAIAASDIEGFVTVRRWPGQALVREVQLANSAVDTIRFLPDGVTVAAALRDGTIALWSTRDGTIATMKDRHPASAIGLAVDGRRNRLVTSGDRGEVMLWDVGDGCPN